MNKPVFSRKENYKNRVDILSKPTPALKQTGLLKSHPKWITSATFIKAVEGTRTEHKASFNKSPLREVGHVIWKGTFLVHDSVEMLLPSSFNC